MIRTAVIGASGYTGAELVTILAQHPRVDLEMVCAESSAGARWESLYPARAHLFRSRLQPFDPERLAGLDVVFLALPHGSSATAASRLRGRVGRIIDLSGDLRFEDPDVYRRWYGLDHPAPELLGKAVYGLPELFGDAIPGAEIIACPGCYATATQLAAAPALDLDETAPDIHVVASSGTSGAGRKGDVALSFSEVFGDLRPYRVGRHQHAPEIAAGLSRRSGRPIRVTFVPQLAPIERGISVAVIIGCRELPSASGLLAHYRDAYESSAFVHVDDPAELLPSVRQVAGTNFCALSPVVDEDGGSIIALGAIDNLLKGAAGQAVQVFNIAAGLPEETGLLPTRKDFG
jgi:N-acetyl-gamma-glutamyl-phosphate reductase